MPQLEFDSLDKIIEFINTDIAGCMRCGVNLSLALVLSAYTEFFGHLLIGTAQSEKSYNAWLRFMGEPYNDLLDNGYKLYDTIRCGLVHEYTMKKRAFIFTERGFPGIEIKNGAIYFNNLQYSEEFLDSIDRYRKKIQANSDLQHKYMNYRLTKSLVL